MWERAFIVWTRDNEIRVLVARHGVLDVKPFNFTTGSGRSLHLVLTAKGLPIMNRPSPHPKANADDADALISTSLGTQRIGTTLMEAGIGCWIVLELMAIRWCAYKA